MGNFLKPLEPGLRFGRLTTTGVYKIFQKKECKRGKDECICDCGNITYVYRKNLYKGVTKSCGCYRDEVRSIVHTKHKDCNTRFYKIRGNMLSRCKNPKGNHWSVYGGKGITVCEERKDYRNFKKDMFDNYNEFVNIHGERNTTIDRIDVNGNYCKENCKWATYKEQCNNKSNNVGIDYNGKHYNSIALLCDDLGIKEKYDLIQGRLKLGRSIERAISEKQHFTYKRS